MEERGLWRLFFATGLPEVYLAVAGQRLEENARWKELARTAFRPRIETL